LSATFLLLETLTTGQSSEDKSTARLFLVLVSQRPIALWIDIYSSKRLLGSVSSFSQLQHGILAAIPIWRSWPRVQSWSRCEKTCHVVVENLLCTFISGILFFCIRSSA
jgi:hypothetical protein